MAKLISLPTFSDSRGKLTVLEKILPFQIKRVFFIYDVKSKRGGHAHKVTQMALVCLAGRTEIYCQTPDGLEQNYLLDNPEKCLLLDPEDWHTMDNFSEHAVLLVLASHEFDKNDHILEKYK